MKYVIVAYLIAGMFTAGFFLKTADIPEEDFKDSLICAVLGWPFVVGVMVASEFATPDKKQDRLQTSRGDD